MATTAEQLEQILRRLPPRYAASEAILAGGATMIAQYLNVVIGDLKANGFFEVAAGAWLDLHARGYGVLRASGEDDAALRVRLRSVGDSVTRSAILDAVDALLLDRGTSVPAVMFEWFERNTVITTEVVAFSFIVGRSFLVTRTNSFIIIVPDFGDLTDPVYASIISEVNRLRGAGIRWSLVVSGAP